MIHMGRTPMTHSEKQSTQKRYAQDRYLSILAKGIDYKTAIAMAGRSEKTLVPWRKDPIFVQREEEARKQNLKPVQLSKDEFDNQLLQSSTLALQQLTLIIESPHASETVKLNASKALLDMLDKSINTSNETKLVNKHLGESAKEIKKADPANDLIESIDLSEFE